jgi:hypothetical protein
MKTLKFVMLINSELGKVNMKAVAELRLEKNCLWGLGINIESEVIVFDDKEG